MDREERIKRMHDYGLTYEEIADIEDISKQRVSRILKPSVPRSPILLNTTAAAEFLGVHPNTLRRWANEGKIDCTRLGSRKDRRFTRQELDKLLKREAHTMKGDEP
jgi:excisionase family DNA binding protein